MTGAPGIARPAGGGKCSRSHGWREAAFYKFKQALNALKTVLIVKNPHLFSILYSLFSILYSLFSILYSLFSILYSLFSVLCSLFSVL